MARTAPVPNMVAIPGMNPGIFVLSGGGGSGDGSGGDGSGSGDGQSSSGNNGGAGANGGGNGAGHCGQGNGGACPNPAHGGAGGTSAGDPIDPITGRVYTTPVVDLDLNGPLPFRLERSYSSDRAAEEVGLGWGWSHTYGLRLREQRRRKFLWIDDPYATPRRIAMPPVGGRVELTDGALLRTADGYALERRGRLYLFRAADVHANDHRLSRVVDRNGNAVSLYYDAQGLATLLDSAGRLIRVRRGERGRIAAFEVRLPSGEWLAFRSYQYDELGRMDAAVGADGHAERYGYDQDNRLLTRTTPAGIQANFVYDARGRCTETWCERSSGESGLDLGVPETLADGGPARGFLHVRVVYGEGGLREVVTSRSVRRIDSGPFGKAAKTVWAGGVHTNAFDSAGRLVSHTDADGNAWRFDFDEAGALLATVDPLGQVTSHEYDATDEVGVVFPDGTSNRYRRDAAGNLLGLRDDVGEVASFEYDERGLMTSGVMANGATTQMAYDAHGNRVEIREPDGSVRRVSYDGLGRVAAFTDEAGAPTSYAYDAMGRVVAVRTPLAEWRYSFDADGELIAQTDPDGRQTRFARGGFGVVTAVIRQDGSTLRYFYDREQDLVRVVDEQGAAHTIERDGEGRILRETTFDGRRLSYKLDANGRIMKIAYDDGEFTEYGYDALGRLVSRSHSDGLEEKLEYDAVGRFVRATSGAVDCSFGYDLRGNLVRQRIANGAKVADVISEFDDVGRPKRVTRSDGQALSYQWDRCRRIDGLRMADDAWIVFQYGQGGRETARRLAGGGVIAHSFDAGGRPVELFVGESAPRQADGHEPQWVGDTRGAAHIAQKLSWSPGDRLQAVDEVGRGRTVDEVDLNGRLVCRRRPNALEERYAYDPKGSMYEPSRAQREYAPGGRLVRFGAWSYHYDARGNVVRKERGGAQPEEWRYEWTVSGRLQRVLGPGVEATFAYDVFARRVTKEVTRGGRVESRASYGWDGDQLVSIAEERARADGAVDGVEWSFAYAPGDPTPLASRRRVNGVDEPWSYWVHSQTECTPLARVDAQGRVVERIEASVFGEMRGTELPLRLPGQIADPEIGLHYNGHRYFDPETGQFLSAEPLGLGGSLLPYAYADNYPLLLVDPSGLTTSIPTQTTVTDRQGRTTTATSGGNQPIHPAVAAALPIDQARAGSAPPPTDNCGEPQALSAYLYDHERRTGRRCDPGTRAGRRELRRALRNLRSIESQQQTDPPTPRAPCPNCSQTISRLYGLAGLSPPRGASPGPETPGPGDRSQQSATRVQPGQRMDGTTGTFESPQPGSPLATTPNPAANQARYEDAVRRDRGELRQQGRGPAPNSEAWRDNANPANPNQPVRPAGSFQHNQPNNQAWGQREDPQNGG